MLNAAQAGAAAAAAAIAFFAWSAEARGETYSRPAAASSSAPKRVVLKIVPQKIVTWDHSKLGGRY
jgi:Cu/Ag efflux protein CusF